MSMHHTTYKRYKQGTEAQKPRKETTVRKEGQERLHEQKALEIHVMFFTHGVGSGVRWGFQRKTPSQHAGCDGGGRGVASECK